MRCPKCYAETSNDALCCPGCKLITPKGRIYLKDKNNKPQTKAKARRKREPRTKRSVGPVLSTVIVVATILVCGIGGYLGMTLLEKPEPQEADSLYLALDRLRQMPSQHSGMTINEWLEQAVDNARKSGQLVESEGWQVNPIEGNNCLISFSYEVKGNVQHRFEWMFDQANDTYTAQTDLAASVYQQQ